MEDDTGDFLKLATYHFTITNLQHSMFGNESKRFKEELNPIYVG